MRADANLKHSVRREAQAPVPRGAYDTTERRPERRVQMQGYWLCWECGAHVAPDEPCPRCTP